MVLFREHRGSLEESMATVTELESWTALVEYVIALVKPYRETTKDDVLLKWYGYDERVNWNTTLVLVKDYGVVGFAGEIKK
jgi:hypothetical protein